MISTGTPDSSSHSAAAETTLSRPLALTVRMAPPAPRRTTSRLGHLDMQADALTSSPSALHPSAATASNRSAPPLRVHAPPVQTSSFREGTRVSEQQKSNRSELLRERIFGIPDTVLACLGWHPADDDSGRRARDKIR